jgi:hypothetical protein
LGFRHAARKMKNSHVLSIVSLSLCYPAAIKAEWIAHAGVQTLFNDNLSYGQLSRDRKTDQALQLDLAGGQHLQLTDATGLALTANIGTSRYIQYNGLNNVYYGAASTLRHKFGLGNAAPWISLAGSANYHDFEYAPRDGWRYQLSVAMGKRLSERLEIQLKYQYEERIADRFVNNPALLARPVPIFGDAFSIAAHSVALTGIFNLSDRLTSYVGYARREGDVTSSTHRNRTIFAASDAIAPDKAFGNDFVAYRINAGSNIFSFGLSWAMTCHASLNLGYERQDSRAGHGLEYSNNIGHLNLLYAF